MLNQIVLDMSNQLLEAKRQVAASIADEKRLAKQVEQETANATEWERRAMLEEQIYGQPLVLPVRRLAADAQEAWAEVQLSGYEGLVAKEEGAAYHSSTQWLKSKVRQEGRFVIGGMATAGAGHQGGVLVGEWDGERLLYRGFVDLGLSRGALEPPPWFSFVWP
jgi:ATP-dependent DNA ligase